MKAREGFILRNLAGEYLLMPKGEKIKNYDSVVLMNELSAFVWEKMQNPVTQSDLLEAVLNEYDVDEKTAREDLDGLLAELKEAGVIDD
jgi:hypothetical protein